MSARPGEPITTAQHQLRRRPDARPPVQSANELKFLGFMISISGVAKNDRVLDVACGSGSTTLAFAERCRGTVGLDVHPEGLARATVAAAERGITNAAFILGELERMPVADGAFDGATCRFSFHHIVHPERVFAEMARAVAPGGWIVISDLVASEDPEKAGLHNELERLVDPMHARSLPVSEFERMFAAHGFNVMMKIARDARLTVDDWIRFGSPPPENVPRIREMTESLADNDGTGLKFTRDGATIRLAHMSVSFVVEKTG